MIRAVRRQLLLASERLPALRARTDTNNTVLYYIKRRKIEQTEMSNIPNHEISISPNMLDLSPMDAVLHTATCEGIGADEEEDGGTLPSPPAQLPPPPLLPRSGARSGTDELIHFNAVSISLALCIPKACSVDDVLAPLLNNKIGHFNYDTEFCRLRGDKPLVAADYIAMETLRIYPQQVQSKMS
ncbi:hypothetical protein MSG28_016149 [Choristoneura fumiferana]|uniref:Uncharacterized protein n=1 Tax=Choristoneura fumiferana TaxID=7141 RepID=A0ACC0K5K2_CHOFU|nr:hypothetical protein MSG28_016149 [Choristoneura fumiferana]